MTKHRTHSRLLQVDNEYAREHEARIQRMIARVEAGFSPTNNDRLPPDEMKRLRIVADDDEVVCQNSPD